jgi:C-terminal processing protease CtpA/Prc
MKHVLVTACSILFAFLPISYGQDLAAERQLHKQILKNLRSDLRQYYYDAKLKGIDLDASLKKADELVEGARSVEEMTDIVARVLYPFDDSHLAFLPPPRTISVDYGWTLAPIGQKVFITSLDESSDAWKKGLRPGDRVHMLDGFLASREHFNLLIYHYEVLAPRFKLTLIIEKPSGNQYKVEIEAKLEKESVFRPTRRDLGLQAERAFRERTRQGFAEVVPGLVVWKIPSFEFSEIKVGKMIGKIEKGQSLILDLRGNAGGLLYSLEELIRVFFEKDIVVGKTIGRKGTDEIKIKGAGKDAFTGKLVVLVDGESASAAELFARVVQLEGRALVAGDRSSGQVMISIITTHTQGLDNLIPYGFNVTIADVIMRDGNRLEKVGVVPDELVLPAPDDLLKKRDPGISRAARLLGFTVTPEQAGLIFIRKGR